MLGWKVPSLGVKDGVTSLVQSWQGYPCHIGSGGQKLSVLQISCEGVPKPIWTGCWTGTIVLRSAPSFQQLRSRPQRRTWKMIRPENGKLKLMFPLNMDIGWWFLAGFISSFQQINLPQRQRRAVAPWHLHASQGCGVQRGAIRLTNLRGLNV